MIACHVIWYPNFVHWEFIFNIVSCYGVLLSLWRHSNSLKFRKNGILRLNQFYLKTALMILIKLGMDFRWGRSQLLMTSLTPGKLPLWRHNGLKIGKIVSLSLKGLYDTSYERSFQADFRYIFFAIMTSSRKVIDVNVLENGDFWGFGLLSYPSNDCLPCNMVP